MKNTRRRDKITKLQHEAILYMYYTTQKNTDCSICKYTDCLLNQIVKIKREYTKNKFSYMSFILVFV